MNIDWTLLACGAATILCTLVAGIFLCFSDFLMRSLARSSPRAGIEVMQVINREVYGTLFMVLLLGMSALAPLLGALAITHVEGPAATLMAAGGGLYLVGVFVVTAARNVPMNKRLDGMLSTDAATITYWTDVYVPRWTVWNHLRAGASLAAAVCFLLAGLLLAGAR